MGKRLVLLAGIPASGKSQFGRWVEERHGILHLDVEKDGRLAAIGLEGSWNRCFRLRDVTAFASQLRSLNRDVIVNWGFPVAWLDVVRQFKSEGFVLWWFGADHGRARQAFAERGDVPLAAFERQVAAISTNWSAIETVFRPNIVTTLDGQGNRSTPEDLLERMFGSAASGDSQPNLSTL
jgi:hypothetical protein